MSTITLNAGPYSAVFEPSRGGMLIALKKDGKDLMHHYDSLKEIDEKPYSFGFPPLFPPNRLDDGKFMFDGKQVDMPLTDPTKGNSCHGYIHNQPWQMDGYTQGDDCAEIHMSFLADENTNFYSYYPFKFSLEVTYILDVNGLHQSLTLTNEDDCRIPTGFGWHSAFALNPEHGTRVQISFGKEIELTERSLPTGRLLELDEELAKFRTPEGQTPLYRVFDNHFTAEPFEKDGKPFHGVILTDPVDRTRTVYVADPKFIHWMMWNDEQNGQYVCLEPQNWRINAPNLDLPAEESGFTVLEVGESVTYRCDVYNEAF